MRGLRQRSSQVYQLGGAGIRAHTIRPQSPRSWAPSHTNLHSCNFCASPQPLFVLPLLLGRPLCCSSSICILPTCQHQPHLFGEEDTPVCPAALVWTPVQLTPHVLYMISGSIVFHRYPQRTLHDLSRKGNKSCRKGAEELMTCARSQSKLGVQAGPARLRPVAAFFTGSPRRLSKADLKNMRFTKFVRKCSRTLQSLQDRGPTAQRACVSKRLRKCIGF